jgi:hypothetical protein
MCRDEAEQAAADGRPLTSCYPLRRGHCDEAIASVWTSLKSLGLDREGRP